MRRHQDGAGDRAAMVFGQGRIHRGGVGTVERAHLHAMAVAHFTQEVAGDGAVGLARQANHHMSPDLGLQTRDGQCLVDPIATHQQHGMADGIHGAHRRPADPGAAAFLGHLHAVGDLEVVAVEGHRFITAQEHAGVGNVGGHREVLGRRLTVEGSVQRHHVEELVRRAAGFGALELVHRGEHAADALTADRPREDHVHPDAAFTQLLGHLVRQRIERRLGHHIGGTAVVLGAREHRGDIDDRRAFFQERRRGAQNVPRHAQDVARRLTQRLGVGRARGAKLLKLFGGQRHLLQRLTRAGRAGVVDQDVDAAMAGHQAGHAGAHAGRVSAIHHHHVGLLQRHTDVLDCSVACRCQPVGGAPGQHHQRTFAQKVAHDLAPEVAGRSGDQGHLACQAARGGHCSAHRSVPWFGF